MRESPCQNIWAPFNSQCDWEVAHWAKTHGSTSSTVTGLLTIPEVVEKLGLSYRNVNELNKIIDQALPGRPTFKRKELIIDGQSQELYFREIIPCIWSLYGDPRLVHDLVFALEHHYTDETRTCRIYNEMHTRNWWWLVQLSLEKQRPGATIIPIILSSDKTQLTLFRSKSAYPVYLTIRNIQKDVRRKPSRCAQMLVGYIPTTCLEHMKNQTGWRCALANLFHGFLAAFVGDYPEQMLVTCMYSSHCPKCLVPPKRLGDFITFPLRDPDVALEVYALADGDPMPFYTACHAADLKPIYHPFWEMLPLSNIFLLITPDILHQLLQGVMKHVLSWVSKPSVFRSEEIDVWCRQLPPNHNITLFTKGITTLSHISGHEHKKILFIPLCHTLSRLDNALSRFHDNKQIFVELGARKDFNFPKLHSLIHYWLERQEKIQYHAAQIQLQQDSNQCCEHIETARPILGPPSARSYLVKMTRNPTVKRVDYDDLAQKYGAIDFQDALGDFIATYNSTTGTGSAVAIRAQGAETLIPFRAVPVYHKVKFIASEHNGKPEVVDSIHARLEQMDPKGRVIPARFDTVLVQSSEHANKRYRVAQVRVVFQIPSKSIQHVFQDAASSDLPKHLAYVEWFTPFSARPNPNHLMYRVSRSTRHGQRLASIIPVESFQWSVHLIPVFGRTAPREWTSFSVLEQCSSFYVNPFSDRDSFLTIE
ncbi:hypothetical protein BJV77DRAFT_1059191 [Russula vinacea]|nr:hypothetical protein BJV77DRAFT_1059191 [Russula vinacea]